MRVSCTARAVLRTGFALFVPGETCMNGRGSLHSGCGPSVALLFFLFRHGLRPP